MPDDDGIRVPIPGWTFVLGQNVLLSRGPTLYWGAISTGLIGAVLLGIYDWHEEDDDHLAFYLRTLNGTTLNSMMPMPILLNYGLFVAASTASSYVTVAYLPVRDDEEGKTIIRRLMGFRDS